MQTVDNREVKVVGTFPHPVTGEKMATIEYLNGIQTTVKARRVEEVTDTDMRANRLIEWLTANHIEADITGSLDGECMSFEHFTRTFREYVSIEVNESGYVVSTCKAGEDASKNERSIKKEATMIKWLEKRLGL